MKYVINSALINFDEECTLCKLLYLNTYRDGMCKLTATCLWTQFYTYLPKLDKVLDNFK